MVLEALRPKLTMTSSENHNPSFREAQPPPSYSPSVSDADMKASEKFELSPSCRCHSLLHTLKTTVQSLQHHDDTYRANMSKRKDVTNHEKAWFEWWVERLSRLVGIIKVLSDVESYDCHAYYEIAKNEILAIEGRLLAKKAGSWQRRRRRKRRGGRHRMVIMCEDSCIRGM